MAFFPRHTEAMRAIRFEEPPVVRRLTFSLVAMATATGVVLHLYRAWILSHSAAQSWMYLGGAIALGVVALLALATLHLGNFTLSRWLWRAPLFGFVEGVAECVTALALIAAGLERVGSATATFADWPRMTLIIVLVRVVLLVVYAAVLAGVVQFVRWMLLRHERRLHTAQAVASHE